MDSYFQNQKNIAIKEKERLHKKSNRISHWRLSVFLLFLFSLGAFLGLEKYYYLLFSLLFLIVFILFIIYHNRIFDQIDYFQLKIETLEEYLARIGSEWMQFPETGEEFYDENKPFLYDLDILGNASLFQYLNIGKSRNGKQKLAERLSNPIIEKAELITNQNAMKEISEKIAFSIDFQIALKQFLYEGGNPNLSSLSQKMKSKIRISLIYYFIFGILSLSNLVFLMLGIMGIMNWFYFISGFLLQFLYSSSIMNLYKADFKRILDISLSISLLEKVYEIIAKEKFADETLMRLQSNIIQFGLQGISSIEKIRNWESYNKFFLTYFLFNGFFSLNLWILYRFSKYLDGFGEGFSKSLDALVEFEVIASLAILGQTKKEISLPKYSEETKIVFTDLKHPLIKEETCVANSFSQTARINIITGSNMSGKTFFLRTIGINMILMNAGGFVNAKEFQSGDLKIFTSMRITDDLSRGISTFYAEILRIKQAIEYSKTKKPMIAFIDEIFKGTNSNDRIQGAISMIEKLNQPHILVFISTHDFELCDMKQVALSNYHFTEYYEGEQIKFDYRIKTGKCQTTNAKYLMKLAGIIES